MSRQRCDYVERSALHPSIRLGGVVTDSCEREALPGMVRCWEHADRQAMAMRIRDLSVALERKKR